jgi:GT2 family glycosyltransferase
MKNRRTRMRPMIEELLSYDDKQFLQCAYSTILGRNADREGTDVYLNCLRTGMSKRRIIEILAKSPEGRSNGVSWVAIAVAIKMEAILRRPLLSSLLRVFRKEPYIREIPRSFDPIWYLREYPDVTKDRISPYYHYFTFGMNEGRCPAFDGDWYLSEYPDVAASGYEPREHYERYGRAQKRHPWFDHNWYSNEYPDVAAGRMEPYAHYVQIGRKEGRQPAYSAHNDYRKWVTAFDTPPSTEMRAAMSARSTRFTKLPLISIVMPVCNTNPAWLVETIGSVTNQAYQRWELCVAYDSQTPMDVRAILERSVRIDPRIRIVRCDANGSIAAVKNSALELVSGEWVALLDPDDLLAGSALFWIVDAINRVPNICMVYSDEDKINVGGVRFNPYFKCDWNPDLFYSHDMFSRIGVYLTSLVRQVSGFRDDFDGSEDYDLTLRCIELVTPNQVYHVPRVLYHRRSHEKHTGIAGAARPRAGSAGLKALNDHLARVGLTAKADSTPHGYRVRYSLPDPPPLVSLIIPTRNSLSLLQKCIASIATRTNYEPLEIMIVDNGSDDAETLLYLGRASSKAGIRVIRDDREFNYSALNNAAIKLARGQIIGLINNDIEVINSDWLAEMVSHAIRPEVGAVGARLWYPDETLQHGGIIFGDGRAWHAHRNIARNDPGYMTRANCIQSLSAVTGACLIVRKTLYEELGGLNEADLPVAFNDVDFCIRALKAGYRNIWTPYAELYHHESATRGDDDTPFKKARARRELNYMQSRWGGELICDPAYSPNLTDKSEDFSLAWPPRIENITNGHHRKRARMVPPAAATRN